MGKIGKYRFASMSEKGDVERSHDLFRSIQSDMARLKPGSPHCGFRHSSHWRQSLL